MSVAWVVGGYNSSLQAKLIYSTDGITWSNSSSATSIFGSYILAIAHNGTIWVAGGQSGSTGILGYSYDGITWYKSTSGSSTNVHPLVSLRAKASSGSSIDYNSSPKTVTKEESSGGSVSKD